MADDKNGEQHGHDILTAEGDVSKDLEQDLNVEINNSERIIYISNSTIRIRLCTHCRHEG